MTTKPPVSPPHPNHAKRFKQLQDRLEGVADVRYLYAQGRFCYVTLTFKAKRKPEKKPRPSSQADKLRRKVSRRKK